MAVTIVAQAVTIVPELVSEVSAFEVVAGVAFWSLRGLGGAGVALYFNWVDERRAAAVADARRCQRLRLAS